MAKNTKAQAAMEFLMTYGWAILAVLVAIAALAHFGILNLDRFLPERCSLPTGITCIDFNVESSSVVLVLQNNLGEAITIDRVDVAKKNGGSCSSIGSNFLKNNEKAVITISDCSNGNVKEKFIGEINLTYTKESLLPHSIKGNIIARITTASSVSSSSICQNAQNGGLCEGLDIVYGEGYQAECCSEHGLCC